MAERETQSRLVLEAQAAQEAAQIQAVACDASGNYAGGCSGPQAVPGPDGMAEIAAELAKHHCDGWGCIGAFADGFATAIVNYPDKMLKTAQCAADVTGCLAKHPLGIAISFIPAGQLIDDVKMAQMAWSGDYYGIGAYVGDKESMAAVTLVTMGALSAGTAVVRTVASKINGLRGGNASSRRGQLRLTFSSLQHLFCTRSLLWPDGWP